MRDRISWSDFAWPGGSSAFHFHCSQRAEFVKVPSFSAKSEAGSRKTSVWIFEASGAPYSFGRLPEGRRLDLDVLDDDQPLQLRERRDHSWRVRAETDRVHPEGDETLRARLLAAGPRRVAAVHVVEDVHPGIVAVDLRQPRVAEVVFLRRGLAVGRLEQGDHELRVVGPVVHRGPGLFVERRRSVAYSRYSFRVGCGPAGVFR